MKFKVRKFITPAIAALGITISFVSPFVVHASDDEVSFKFKIWAWSANSNTAGRYRQTTNPDNPWKVELLTSGEGAGTVTTFFLENDYGKNLSRGFDTKVNSGKHYHPAYDSASKTTVFMSAENNNYNSTEYMVSGNWDEETN